jgi:hypothetical protein
MGGLKELFLISFETIPVDVIRHSNYSFHLLRWLSILLFIDSSIQMMN